ncbi:MAG: hypothetical protein DLM50_08215 [Candidatus Meridianibacter frigidus]|nr:MAG: hypothetical protein DLM50_08215 [Candidatus Eremiobacteraeota bacterium]
MKAASRATSLFGFLLVAALATASALAVTNNLEVTSADKDFVAKAIHGGDVEIGQAHRMANSKDAQVRLFARLMIRDHTSANTKLAALAEQYGIKYPQRSVQSAGSESGDSASASISAMKTGTAHPPVGSRTMTPSAYMQSELTAHMKTIDLLKGEVSNGTNQNIKNWVGNTLPTVQGHLLMIKQYLTGQKMTMPTPAPGANNPTSH